MTTAVPSAGTSSGSRGIRIRRLRLFGIDRHYEVDFVNDDTDAPNSLSIIAGAFSSGKTAVLEFIDYCLGASDHPRHHEVMRKVKTATVEVELSGAPYLIERSVGEASSHAFVRPGRLDDGGGPPAERRPIRPAGSPDSLSSFLLSHCGLEGVLLREAPTQASSDTDPLSFRDLMWLCFLSNEQLASKNLLFENNSMKNIKLKQVVDVVFDVHDDRAAALGQRIKELETRLARARATYEAAQQLVDEQRLGGRMELEASRDRAGDELSAVEGALTVLDQRVRAATSFADDLRRRHREAASEARRVAASLRDRETQLRRMVPLRAQYAEDVAKLTMLAEAHQLFDPLRVRVCPACLSFLEAQMRIEDGSCSLCRSPVLAAISELNLGHTVSAADDASPNGHLSSAAADDDVPTDKTPEQGTSDDAFDVGRELRATKARLTELTRFVDELDADVPRLRAAAEHARGVETRAAADVDNATNTAISPYLAERDALTRRRQDAATAVQRANAGLSIITSLERRGNDVARQDSAVKARREELATTTHDQTDRAAIIRRISNRYRDILVAWKYPKLNNAYLNNELVPFMRDNRYTAASSGGRTLISLAWILAVFEIAWESGGAHPGFLFLDSPQKNLGQTDRDAEFADSITIADIYRHLHTWLAGAGAGAQVVIADNAPPAEADDDVIVRFSRRLDQPPYGLIDDETG
jgi:hypothetical protein